MECHVRKCKEEMEAKTHRSWGCLGACWIHVLGTESLASPYPTTEKREPGPNEADTRVGEFWLPFLFLVEGGQIREGDAV